MKLMIAATLLLVSLAGAAQAQTFGDDLRARQAVLETQKKAKSQVPAERAEKLRKFAAAYAVDSTPYFKMAARNALEAGEQSAKLPRTSALLDNYEEVLKVAELEIYWKAFADALREQLPGVRLAGLYRSDDFTPTVPYAFEVVW